MRERPWRQLPEREERAVVCKSSSDISKGDDVDNVDCELLLGKRRRTTTKRIAAQEAHAKIRHQMHGMENRMENLKACRDIDDDNIDNDDAMIPPTNDRTATKVPRKKGKYNKGSQSSNPLPLNESRWNKSYVSTLQFCSFYASVFWSCCCMRADLNSLITHYCLQRTTSVSEGPQAMQERAR